MPKETNRKQVLVYTTRIGDKPLQLWLDGLRDKVTRVRIIRHLERIKLGNLGDHKWVGNGVWELRLFFGAGFRVYFAKEGKDLILLLCGGDKHTQKKDIKLAIKYLQDYKERMT